MPTATFEGKDYNFPEGTSQQEMLDFIDSKNKIDKEAANLKDPGTIGGYALETMKNIPRSAANLIGGSAKTVGKVASTGYNLLTDPYKELSETGPIDAKQGLYNTFNYFKDRYSHPLDTLREDPVGTMADVSTLASGASAGLRALPGLSQAGEALRGVGALTDPLRSGSTLAGAVTRVLRQAAAEGLYGRSLPKIPRDPNGLPLMDKVDLTNEGLRSQIPRSLGGARKANDTISNLAHQVDELATQIQAAGGKIDMNNVIPELARSYKEFGHVAPQTDWKLIDQVRDDFIDRYGTPSTVTKEKGTGLFDANNKEIITTESAPGPNVPGDMSPTGGAEVKKKTYLNVGKSAYTSTQQSATIEAMTDLARGLKKELERLDTERRSVASPLERDAMGPTVKSLNERQGNLIDLRKLMGGAPEVNLEHAAASQAMGYHGGVMYGLRNALPYAGSEAALSIAPGPPIAGPVRSVARAIGKGLTPAGTVGKAMSYSTKDPYQIEVVK